MNTEDFGVSLQQVPVTRPEDQDFKSQKGGLGSWTFTKYVGFLAVEKAISFVASPVFAMYSVIDGAFERTRDHLYGRAEKPSRIVQEVASLNQGRAGLGDVVGQRVTPFVMSLGLNAFETVRRWTFGLASAPFSVPYQMGLSWAIVATIFKAMLEKEKEKSKPAEQPQEGSGEKVAKQEKVNEGSVAFLGSPLQEESALAQRAAEETKDPNTAEKGTLKGLRSTLWNVATSPKSGLALAGTSLLANGVRAGYSALSRIEDSLQEGGGLPFDVGPAPSLMGKVSSTSQWLCIPMFADPINRDLGALGVDALMMGGNSFYQRLKAAGNKMGLGETTFDKEPVVITNPWYDPAMAAKAQRAEKETDLTSQILTGGLVASKMASWCLLASLQWQPFMVGLIGGAAVEFLTDEPEMRAMVKMSSMALRCPIPDLSEELKKFSELTTARKTTDIALIATKTGILHFYLSHVPKEIATLAGETGFVRSFMGHFPLLSMFVAGFAGAEAGQAFVHYGQELNACLSKSFASKEDADSFSWYAKKLIEISAMTGICAYLLKGKIW